MIDVLFAEMDRLTKTEAGLRLLAIGFKVTTTGGGCMAFERGEELLTYGNDAYAPEHLSDPVFVSRSDEERERCAGEAYATLADYLATQQPTRGV